MARIRIPARLDKKLGKSALANSVRLYVQRFDEWVGDDTKGLFFFPEYTDHGPKHVSSVLAGAEALILEDAWKAVTPEDVAVLVTAALLHDSAMHLSADGFLALLDPTRLAERPIIRPLDDRTWPELFESFFAEARRWDQRKLHRILGDEATPAELEPDLIDYIKRPADVPNPETWSVRYRKFLGEFIRRHHARLAHEIALSGYPGHQPNVLVPPAELSKYSDLAGLVARSHNMHLRDTFGHLEKYYGPKTCLKTHPVFLMVLLRIADYLEICADRVNTTALQIQRLRSPISQEEQSSHLSVDEVRWPHDQDEEAIFVIAKPATARMFLKLQSLLRGLQIEFDTSWAVLGEVFSRDRELRCFGIRLRRVRSNLDSPADFLRREKPDYFPIQAAFDTTGADLLKLLIKPLYGDRPEIGVRELLQNALDAVHELRQWARNHGEPDMEKIPLPQQEADVLISIDNDEAGEAWLTVRDKGIGMTTEVIRDYFLKAGASYRASTAWRQSFEDENGGSKVLRSGRFGIGALAAFLLGDRIEVATRHISAPAEFGISFSASVNDGIVQFQRVPLVDVGTTVRIKLPNQVFNYLCFSEDKWDWYAADDLKVERWVLGRSLGQGLHLPPVDDNTSDWNKVFPVGFKSLLWGFSRDLEGLACNGIIVTATKSMFIERSLNMEIEGPFAVPFISVLDPDGNLPLNLQRDKLMTDEPFRDDVLTDAICELCAFVLSWGPTSVMDFSGVRASLGSRGWPLLAYYGGSLWPICLTARGFTLSARGTIVLSGFRRALLFLVKAAKHLEASLISQVEPCLFCRFSWSDNLDEEDSKHELNTVVRSLGGNIKEIRYILEEKGEQWKIRTFGTALEASCLGDISERIKGRVPRNSLKVIELWFPEDDEPKQSPFLNRLMTILDHPIIPYDPAERKRQLPRAFERLEKHLERWKPENLTGWRLKQVEWFRGGPVGGATSKPKKGRSRSRRP